MTQLLTTLYKHTVVFTLSHLELMVVLNVEDMPLFFIFLTCISLYWLHSGPGCSVIICLKPTLHKADEIHLSAQVQGFGPGPAPQGQTTCWLVQCAWHVTPGSCLVCGPAPPHLRELFSNSSGLKGLGIVWHVFKVHYTGSPRFMGVIEFNILCMGSLTFMCFVCFTNDISQLMICRISFAEFLQNLCRNQAKHCLWHMAS